MVRREETLEIEIPMTRAEAAAARRKAKAEGVTLSTYFSRLANRDLLADAARRGRLSEPRLEGMSDAARDRLLRLRGSIGKRAGAELEAELRPLPVTLSPAERATLERAASATKLPVEKWVRQKALQAAGPRRANRSATRR